MSLCNPASTCWGHVMVWTPETRHRVGDVGCGGRLSDAEFALLSPMLPPAKPGGRPRTTEIARRARWAVPCVAHRLPMAPSAGGIPAVADGVRILAGLYRGRGVGRDAARPAHGGAR